MLLSIIDGLIKSGLCSVQEIVQVQGGRISVRGSAGKEQYS